MGLLTLTLIILFGKSSGAPIQVEIGLFASFNTSLETSALTYTGPAVQAAVGASNQRYAGFLNFSLQFARQARDNQATLVDDGAYIVGRWYYCQRLFPNGIGAMIATGILGITGHYKI